MRMRHSLNLLVRWIVRGDRQRTFVFYPLLTALDGNRDSTLSSVRIRESLPRE